jgi:nucleotide-binding universal stress UspA family protein
VSDPVLVGVALDERDPAPIAAGRALARLTTGRIALLNAYPYEPLLMPTPEYEDDLRKEAIEGLERLAESLRGDLEVAVYAYPRVSVAHALQEAADALEAIALVVGSSRGGVLGRVFPGGTADRLLSGAPCPVTVSPTGPPGESFRRIGVAYDDSREARDALEAATALACAAGATVTTYTVVEPIETAPALTTPGWAVPQSYADDRDRHAEAAARAARERVPEEVLAGAEVLTGDAALRLAEVSSDLDLMTCGSRAYGPVRAVVLGSVSTKLVQSAACPLLITPRGHGGELAAAAGHD